MFKVKKLHPEAKLPKRNNPTDSGLDLCSDEDVVIHAGQRRLVGTGIAIQLTPGWEGQVRSRSGLAAKNGICVLNSPGTVDASYTGPVKVILLNTSDSSFEIKRGDRIAQLVICPVNLEELVEVEELDATDRGDKGFGSSGVK